MADFGLSKRIEDVSGSKSKVYGVIPYIDPKRSNRQRNVSDRTQICLLNQKGDVYSVGVLLWEISSGKPPFYVEGESYDIVLAVEIAEGLRETIIPDTPIDYANLYTGKYILNSIIIKFYLYYTFFYYY